MQEADLLTSTALLAQNNRIVWAVKVHACIWCNACNETESLFENLKKILKLHDKVAGR